jgi:Mrp family chromosome partitioning ATPase
MGRMIDILRTADRRPVAESPPTPVELDEREDVAEPVAAQSITISEPPLEDDDDVPFIEVGGGREPSLRIVPASLPSPGFVGEGPGVRERLEFPHPPAPSPIRAEGEQQPRPSPPAPLPQSRERGELQLLTICFQAVHAAGLGGRGPAAELIAFHEPEHAVSVQYRSLAAEIGRQLPGNSPRVLLFAGAADGVGASTVLLNLAVMLAKQEMTVTVVDAHVARPALGERLGLPPAPGLREVLAGQMPPAWCLQETVLANLCLLPAGLIGRPRDDTDVAAIVESLRDRNDCVLIDAGPWADAGLTAGLAGGSDAVYLVVRQESAAESTALQDTILQQTGRLRGCVLTARET